MDQLAEPVKGMLEPPTIFIPATNRLTAVSSSDIAAEDVLLVHCTWHPGTLSHAKSRSGSRLMVRQLGLTVITARILLWLPNC
jgi:hypothetical protein